MKFVLWRKGESDAVIPHMYKLILNQYCQRERGGSSIKKRHFPRGVTALLLLAILLSASVTTAFAADTPVPCSNRDIEFYEEAPTLTSFAQTGTGEKDDDTPAWMRINRMPNGSFIRVRIVGSNVEDHACTYSEYNS